MIYVIEDGPFKTEELTFPVTIEARVSKSNTQGLFLVVLLVPPRISKGLGTRMFVLEVESGLLSPFKYASYERICQSILPQYEGRRI